MSGSGYLGAEQSIMMQVKDMMHDKTLIKSPSKTKNGLMKGVHLNVYADKNFMVMNENRGPVMIMAQKMQTHRVVR